MPELGRERAPQETPQLLRRWDHTEEHEFYQALVVAGETTDLKFQYPGREEAQALKQAIMIAHTNNLAVTDPRLLQPVLIYNYYARALKVQQFYPVADATAHAHRFIWRGIRPYVAETGRHREDPHSVQAATYIEIVGTSVVLRDRSRKSHRQGVISLVADPKYL